MAAQISSLVAEATTLDLFKPHGAFEVHCSNCHSRLNPMGDCSNCGIIGRPAAEIEKRAQADPAGLEKLLKGAIAKRRGYRPVKG